MSLQIRKKSTTSWEHIKGGQNIILSAGSFRLQNAEFELTELSGVDQFDQPRTPLADITLYDDTTTGLPEVFSNTTDFVNRLRALNYPFFSTTSGGSGVVTSVNTLTGDVVLGLAELDNVPPYPNDGQDYVLVENNGAVTWQLFSSGGGGDTPMLIDFSQTGHGLSVGDWVVPSGGNMIKGNATSLGLSAIVGVVSSVADANNFTYQVGGYVLGLSPFGINFDHYLQDDGTIGITPGTIERYVGRSVQNNALLINLDYSPSTSGSGTLEQALMFACSDETTDLTVSTNLTTFAVPFDITLTDVRAFVATAPTGSSLICDIKKNGVSILSTLISIDAGEKNSEDAATPPVISDTSLSKDDEITVDITQIGSTVAGAGLKISLIYNVTITIT